MSDENPTQEEKDKEREERVKKQEEAIQAAEQEIPKLIADIKKIIDKTSDGNYIFRGEKEDYAITKEKKEAGCKKNETRTTSTLYRARQSLKSHLVGLEEYSVKQARGRYSLDTRNIEILTELQHNGGNTNLIDFTKDLNIALFFACFGETTKVTKNKEKDCEETVCHSSKDGRLLLLDTNGLARIEDIDYDKILKKEENKLVEPTRIDRALAQSSVFVYAPSGRIKVEFIEIKHEQKYALLRYLRKYHNITFDTIFNDIHGFIKREKEYPKAQEYFDNGLASDPQGEFKEAIKDLDKAIELNPNDAEAYNNRGMAKGKLGRHEAAIKDLDKAIELNPKDAAAYNNRGVAKGRLGRHEEAIKDLDKAIELNPKNAVAYNNRGIAKDNLGRDEEAIKDYDKAIELNPNYAEAYNNRGFVKGRLGRHEEAIKDLDKAIELNPKDAEAYNNRGFVKGRLGRHEEAIKDLDKAIELNPKYALAYYNRGNAKSELGDNADTEGVKKEHYEEAIDDCNKAKQLFKKQGDSKMRSLCRDTIKEIEAKLKSL